MTINYENNIIKRNDFQTNEIHKRVNRLTFSYVMILQYFLEINFLKKMQNA